MLRPRTAGLLPRRVWTLRRGGPYHQAGQPPSRPGPRPRSRRRYAFALRALSQRFPEGTEMNAADRALLGDLARGHVQALTSQLNELHRTLAPVLVSLGGSTAQGRPANSRMDWQPAVEDLFQSTRR